MDMALYTIYKEHPPGTVAGPKFSKYKIYLVKKR